MFLLTIAKKFLKTSTYHKSIYSSLLLNHTNFTFCFYKIGALIKCLIDTAYKINNTWPGFHDDFSKIKDVLKRNSYPPFILHQIIEVILTRFIITTTKFLLRSINYDISNYHILASILNRFRKK